MADIFDILSKQFANGVDENATAVWTRDTLSETLRSNMQSHSAAANITKDLSDQNLKNWLAEVVQPRLMNNPSRLKSIYDDYRKNLKTTAQNEERKRPFSSLTKANESFAAILSSVLKRMDTLFENGEQDLSRLKMSQLAVLGLLKQSDMILDFTNFLFTYLVRVGAGDVDSIPRYREIFLLDRYADVAVVVSDVLDRKGSYTFLAAIDDMKKKQADVSFGFTGAVQGERVSYLTTTAKTLWNSTAARWVLGSLIGLSAAYFAVKHGPVIFDDYRMARHNKNKETKQWLEAHLAFLRMQMGSMEPSDPKYMRMQSIIRAYDTKLAEYDQKINRFEQARGGE